MYALYCVIALKRRFETHSSIHIPLDDHLLMILAVTCYWIDDDFVLHEALLDFVELSGKHEGELLAPVILKVLNDFGIENKLFCLTTDSASNNGTMCKAMSRLLLAKGIYWDYKQRHIPCMTHIIHNNAKAFMKAIKAAAADNDGSRNDPNDGSRNDPNGGQHQPDLNEITLDGIIFSDLLATCRSLAKKIRTEYGWEEFKNICKAINIKPLKIVLDTATRWGSTHRMLERILYLRKAVNLFAANRDDCQNLIIDDAQWNLLELVCGFLWPFRWATEALESTEKPELDRVFWIYNKLFSQIEGLEKTLEAREALGETWVAELLDALEKMHTHLRGYYIKSGQSVYSDSMILHPRIKLKLFDSKEWDEGDADYYKKICRDNYNADYAELRLSDTETTTSYAGLSQKRKANQLDDEYDQYLNEQLESTSVRGHELDMYLLEPTAHVKCALDYWRVNHRKYPHLAMMVRDVMAVPPSGSGVEREFSIAGRVATWQRNQLHPETITAIMIYKNYLRRCRWELKLDVYHVAPAELGTEEDVEQEPPEEEEEAMKTIDEWRKDWRARLDGVRGTRRV
jgi:hypothetical protein